MDPEQYLKNLNAELKGLSASERAELIEEISNHLEEGAADPALGPDPAGRARRLEIEMGSPAALGRGFKDVYRPQRWLDYLLIVVPDVLVLPLALPFLSSILPQGGSGPLYAWPAYFWGIRMAIFVHLGLVGLGWLVYRRRDAPGVLFYWLVSTCLSVFALLLREQRWQSDSIYRTSAGGIFGTVFWSLVLLALLAWLALLVWRKRDPLYLTLALLPIMLAAGNLATGQMMAAGGFGESGYQLPVWRIGWYFGLPQAAQVIWPALFFLFKQRPLRWLGLLAYILPLALMNAIASARYQHLLLLWVLPVVVVLGGWLFETRTQRQVNMVK